MKHLLSSKEPSIFSAYKNDISEHFASVSLKQLHLNLVFISIKPSLQPTLVTFILSHITRRLCRRGATQSDYKHKSKTVRKSLHFFCFIFMRLVAGVAGATVEVALYFLINRLPFPPPAATLQQLPPSTVTSRRRFPSSVPAGCIDFCLRVQFCCKHIDFQDEPVQAFMHICSKVGLDENPNTISFLFFKSSPVWTTKKSTVKHFTDVCSTGGLKEEYRSGGICSGSPPW